MRDIVRIKLKDLRQTHLREVLCALEAVFEELGVQFYILGALARDTWYAKESLDSRTTRDIDYAVYVSSFAQYQQVHKLLLKNYGFQQVPNDPYRLRTPFGYNVDLIPFGASSIDDAIHLEDSLGRPVFINGFEEILNKAIVTAEIEGENLTFPVATLAGITLLKLLAYDDRPEHRAQDPGDIAEIVQVFFDIESEMIYEKHSDLFERDLALHEYASAVIGREIGTIIRDNQTLRKRTLQIVSLSAPTQRRMVEAMVSGKRNLEQVEMWFSLMKEGIESITYKNG